MSEHIQGMDQAKSFIDAYYSAVTSDQYVCWEKGTYSVGQGKIDLRTNDIAKLAFEAFEHCSRLKDLVCLYDALESHVNRLDPTVIRFLRGIHIPGVSFIRTLVLHVPFTTSANMLATMERIEASISYEILGRRDLSDQDLADFDVVTKWYITHKKDTPARKFIALSAQIYADIQKANTVQELISSTERLKYCPMARIKQKAMSILKQKIKDSSPQFANLKADQVGKMATHIESLDEELVEMKVELREQLKQRIISEATLSGIIKIYNDVKLMPCASLYTEICWNKVGNLVPPEIERVSSLEELLKIAGMFVDCWEIGERFQTLIEAKIKTIIPSQEDIIKLLMVIKTLRSISSQRVISSEIRSLILEQVEKITSLQSNPVEALKDLKELARSLAQP